MLSHNYIGTEHILLGLIHEGEGVARRLESLDISLEAVRAEVEKIIGQGQQAPMGTSRSRRAPRRCSSCPCGRRCKLGHNYIGTEHILLGLIRENEGVAAQVLMNLGADLDRVREEVIQLLSGTRARSRPPRPPQAAAPPRSSAVVVAGARPASAATSPRSPARASSTRSSAATTRSSGSSRSCPPHQEQPGAARRGGRRQDGHRRGPGPAHRRGQRARDAPRQADRRARPGDDGRRHDSTAASSRSASRR